MRSAVIDAELVATDVDGIADFAALHRLMSRRQEGGLVAFAFDLMMLDGQDIRSVPYINRKPKLARIVQRSQIAWLHHSEALRGGEKLLVECSCRRLEGIVSKRRDSLYRSG